MSRAIQYALVSVLVIMIGILVVLGFMVVGQLQEQNRQIDDAVVLQSPEQPGFESEPLTDSVAFSPSVLTDSRYWQLPIPYSINEAVCGAYESNKLRQAFNDITDATDGLVTFTETADVSDRGIAVDCSFIEDCYERTVDIQGSTSVHTETICEHTRGIAQVTGTDGPEIVRATITMFGFAGFAETDGEGPSGFYVGTCGNRNTEIHEILHTLGYGHVFDDASIMAPSDDSVGFKIQDLGNCEGSIKTIDSTIVDDLVSTYSGVEPGISGRIINLSESDEINNAGLLALVGIFFFLIYLVLKGLQRREAER